MSNAIFPSFQGQSWPVTREAIWSSQIQSSVSGKETRIAFWSYPIYEYTINFEVLKSIGPLSDLENILGFYNLKQGAFDDWLFEDNYDSSALDQPFGIGDGSSKVFQLTRSYGGYTEPVRAVKTLTSVKVNGILEPNTTLDWTVGKITFSNAPALGALLTWSGIFYWRCRFKEDKLSHTRMMLGLNEIKSLKFRTLK